MKTIRLAKDIKSSIYIQVLYHIALLSANIPWNTNPEAIANPQIEYVINK